MQHFEVYSVPSWHLHLQVGRVAQEVFVSTVLLLRLATQQDARSHHDVPGKLQIGRSDRYYLLSTNCHLFSTIVVSGLLPHLEQFRLQLVV